MWNHTIEELEILKQMMNLVSVEDLTDYETALLLCFSLGSLGDQVFPICEEIWMIN